MYMVFVSMLVGILNVGSVCLRAVSCTYQNVSTYVCYVTVCVVSTYIYAEQYIFINMRQIK